MNATPRIIVDFGPNNGPEIEAVITSNLGNVQAIEFVARHIKALSTLDWFRVEDYRKLIITANMISLVTRQ